MSDVTARLDATFLALADPTRLGAALLAGVVPPRRAASVERMEALRQE